LYEIRYFIAAAFRNLFESKVTSLFTAVTLSVALGFVGAYLMLFINMKSALDAVSEKFPLTIYVEDGISRTQRDALEKALKSDPVVTEFGYTSKDEALSEFTGAHKGERPLIEGLGRNPLPASYDVRLKPDAGVDAATKLVESLRGMRGVDEVQYLQEEAGKLKELLRSFRIAGIVLGLGVLLGVVFISYSTLRLAVLAHKDEIEVLKLMGATRPFIMAPFLFEGVIQGVIAASLSLGLLYGLLRAFSGASALALLSPSGLSFLPVSVCAGIVLAGGVLGLTGSFFAFSRTLRM